MCDDPSDGILAAEKIMEDRVFGEAGKPVDCRRKTDRRRGLYPGLLSMDTISM